MATEHKEDNEDYYRDPNPARYPAHQLEPAVQATFTSQPNFPTRSIDVFACRSTLGNLLRFVRKVEKPFRMLIQVVRHLIFFIRKGNSPTELIASARGFGHTFPDVYTTRER